MKGVCGIYKITSPTGKVYIGRSFNIKKRFGEHRFYSDNTLIGRSIRKYGIENHSIDIVCRCVRDNELLNKLEVFFIKHYDSTNTNIGLNLSHGGGRLGFNHTDVTIKKMRENRKGKNNSKGRVLSDETKALISNSLKGNRLSKDTIEKIKRTSNDRGISFSVLDNDGGIFYGSLNEAIRATGFGYHKYKRLFIKTNRHSVLPSTIVSLTLLFYFLFSQNTIKWNRDPYNITLKENYQKHL